MLIIQLNDLKMAIYLKITNPTEVVKKDIKMAYRYYT